MVRIRGYLRVVWCIVIAKNQCSIGVLVMIAIEDLLDMYAPFDGFFLES